LAPMSAVAGRMSIQAGAHSLEKNQKGRGILLGGAPGVDPATVVILGGGVVGENAALIATGMKAKVHIVDKSTQRLEQLKEIFGDTIIPEQSDKVDLKKLISECVLLIGGVLIPGAEAPKLITKNMLKFMKRGSVIVDVAIDQGGCVETSRPTTHANPTYIVDDVVHYCVTNMPGGVPRTSTLALNKATLPFLSKLADKGCEKALREDKLLNITKYASPPGKPQDVLLFYGQSEQFIKYLITDLGNENFTKFIKNLKSGKSINNAMLDIYGLDKTGLENKWRKHIGASLITNTQANIKRPKSPEAQIIKPYTLNEVITDSKKVKEQNNNSSISIEKQEAKSKEQKTTEDTIANNNSGCGLSQGNDVIILLSLICIFIPFRFRKKLPSSWV